MAMRWLSDIWFEFWKDKISNRLLWVSLGMYLFVLGWVWWLSGGWWGWLGEGQKLPPEFPLWFSLPRGGEQLAVMDDLWLVSWGLGGLLLIDLILAILLMKKFRVLAYAVLWTAILSVGMWGFGVLRVYLLVG